jgi:hypothetical protein
MHHHLLGTPGNGSRRPPLMSVSASNQQVIIIDIAHRLCAARGEFDMRDVPS